jgi:hypothetical protein
MCSADNPAAEANNPKDQYDDYQRYNTKPKAKP